MSSETLSSKAYQEIRRKIATGELASRQQVSELSLSKEIGIGRTPVREAIRRLQQEGWVEQVPRFGTIVRQTTRQELAELYEVRDAIESFAAALAATRISVSDIELLQNLCERLGDSIRVQSKKTEAILDAERTIDFLRDDMTFHMLILGAAGNSRMIKIFAETRALGRILDVRQQHPVDLSILKTTYRDHSRIARALKARNEAESRKAMSLHIQNSRRMILDHFEVQTAASLSTSVDIPIEIRELLQPRSAKAPNSGQTGKTRKVS